MVTRTNSLAEDYILVMEISVLIENVILLKYPCLIVISKKFYRGAIP